MKKKLHSFIRITNTLCIEIKKIPSKTGEEGNESEPYTAHFVQSRIIINAILDKTMSHIYISRIEKVICDEFYNLRDFCRNMFRDKLFTLRPNDLCQLIPRV
jgi:hypothetical protein